MASPAEFIDDPRWVEVVPEDGFQPVRRRGLPSHGDCSQLDVAAAAAHLASGGVLGAMPGYEERPGQIEMLKAVARAFNGREHLMIEAGTGVGKSIAYLVPAILWAWTNDTTVVVSTATRNLQGQLVESDIPKALAVLGEKRGEFRTALLKGRTNYLCLRAVGDFFAPGFWTMSKEERDEMPRFIEWLKTTPDGDLDTYDGLPSGLISCPGEECGGARCPYRSRCFVRKARRRAADAHLVVANHSLVLAEAAGGGAGAILPAYGRLILDEAHNLEAIATDCLGAEFSMDAFMRIVSRLARKGRGRRARPGGALASVERLLQRGAFSGAAAEEVAAHLREAPPAVARAVAAVDATLDCAARLFAPAGGRDTLRHMFSDGRRRYSVKGLFREYSPEEWSEADLAEAESRMENALAGVVKTLHGLRDALEKAGGGDDGGGNGNGGVSGVPGGDVAGQGFGDMSGKLSACAASIVEFANEAHFALGARKETHAYWIERVAPRGRGRPGGVRLLAAPLSVAESLESLLWSRKDTAILSSATLRVGGDFKYMARRLGCGERFQALCAPSPFNYLLQCRALAADWLPDPATDSAGYAAALADLLAGLFGVTGGRALVLFTSYELMNGVAAAARGAFESLGIDLLVQGGGMSREHMAGALKAGARTVLFGAQSFWEGVDVPGEALSCVVIAKLPFAQVGDPIVEARSEKIERDGGSAFRDYALPEAVIRFRQGFGRLVRSKRDRGVVVVTDPRLATRNYGAVFRKSVPAPVSTAPDRASLLEAVGEFFGEGDGG